MTRSVVFSVLGVLALAPACGSVGGGHPPLSKDDAGVGGGGAGGTAGAGTDAGVAAVRCDQPVSAGACTGQVAHSCQELYDWGVRTDNPYLVDPDGAGPNLPFATFCQMDAQNGIGWTLMAKIHTANVDSVAEPRPWFVSESHTDMLMFPNFHDNQSPASHGAYKFAPLVNASSIARFELHAQLDTTQVATWYKAVASAASLQSWFTPNDTVASNVCTDLAMTLNCTQGTISPQEIPDGPTATALGGMSLTPYGYTASGPLHMRLDDDMLPMYSGVCSNTFDNDGNKWMDSYDTHWGNGLLIYLNER